MARSKDVFYTGTQAWTGPLMLSEIVRRGDQLTEIIPNILPMTVNLPKTAPDLLQSFGGYFGCVLQLFQARKSDHGHFSAVLAQVVSELGRANQVRRLHSGPLLVLFDLGR